MTMRALISVCLAAIPYAVYGTEFTPAEQQELLAIHNAARARVSGCEALGRDANKNFVKLPGLSNANGLSALQWDADLAAAADAKLTTGALACQFAHDTTGSFGYGENLAQQCSSSSINVGDAIITAGKGWIDDELARYQYGASGNICLVENKDACGTVTSSYWDNIIDGNCGHYTQVIAEVTTHIGCAYRKNCNLCPITDESGNIIDYMNDILIACAFNPAGNMAGSPPYVSGNECDNDYVAPTSQPTGSCAITLSGMSAGSVCADGNYELVGYRSSDNAPYYKKSGGDIELYLAPYSSSFWIISGAVASDGSAAQPYYYANNNCAPSDGVLACDNQAGYFGHEGVWGVSNCGPPTPAPPTPPPVTPPTPPPVSSDCDLILGVGAGGSSDGEYVYVAEPSSGNKYYKKKVQVGGADRYLARLWGQYWAVVAGVTSTGEADYPAQSLYEANNACGGNPDVFTCDGSAGYWGNTWSVTDCNGGFEADDGTLDGSGSSGDSAVIAVVVALVVLFVIVVGGGYWFWSRRSGKGQVEFNNDIGIDEKEKEKEDEEVEAEEETEEVEEIEVEVPITTEMEE